MSTQEKQKNTRTRTRTTQPTAAEKQAAAEAAEVKAIALAVAEGANDGSSVSDMGRMRTILSDLRTGLGTAIAVTQNLTDIVADLARLRAEARSIVLDSAGRPQWNQRVQLAAYTATVAAAEAAVFEHVDNDVKGKVLGPVRTMLVRNFLEPAICQYVLTLEGMSKYAAGGEAGLGWTEATKRRPSVPTPFGKDLPKEFRDAVAHEYARCELAVPEKFGGTSTPGGKSKTPGGADAEVAQAISAAEKGTRTQLATVTDCVRLGSALLSGQMKQATPPVADREKVEALSGRAALIFSAYAKLLAGKLEGSDFEAARSLIWTEADQKAHAAS